MFCVGDKVVVVSLINEGLSDKYIGQTGTIEQLGSGKYNGEIDYRVAFDNSSLNTAMLWECNLRPNDILPDFEPNIDFLNSIVGGNT